MIQVLLVLSSIIVLFFVFKSDIESPSKIIIMLFSSYWILSVIMASWGLYGLHVPSDYTYILVFINLGSFLFGFTRLSKTNINLEDFRSNIILCLERMAESKAVKIVSAIFGLYIYSKIIVFWNVLLVYNNSNVLRNAFFFDNMYGLEFPYVNYFLVPLFVFFSPIFCYTIIHKRNLTCLFTGLFLIGYVIISVSRFGYVRMALAIVFLEMVLGISNLSFKKMIAMLSGFFAIVFIALVLTTGARSGNADSAFKDGKEEAFEDLVTYSCGPTVALDYAITNDYLDKMGGYQYGRLTLSSLDSFIKLASYNLFHINMSTSIGKFSELKQETSISISSRFEWNALYTAIIFFYLDFGIIGVLIIPFIIGLLFRKLLRFFYTYPTYSMLVIAFYFFRATIFSVIDYDFLAPFMSVLLIVMYSHWKKERPRILTY